MHTHTTALSLITPSGRLTLGNYLGALRQMNREPGVYGIADLHAMTATHSPEELRSRVHEITRLFLAVGLEGSVLFRQSRVPEHAQLAYLLECTAYVGELKRMIQFKEKGRNQPKTRVSLYTYPVLMAADILLYRPRLVPVGDDQRQHVELTRDLAVRFNRSYGEVFVVPELAIPPLGGRIMDLAHPERKMSKSATDLSGTILMLDPPDVIRRKVARAVTDSVGVVQRSLDQPGVSNLIDILEACGGSLGDVSTYGALKDAVTEAVLSVLTPIQQAHAELSDAQVTRQLLAGEAAARERAAPTYAAARDCIGL